MHSKERKLVLRVSRQTTQVGGTCRKGETKNYDQVFLMDCIYGSCFYFVFYPSKLFTLFLFFMFTYLF